MSDYSGESAKKKSTDKRPTKRQMLIADVIKLRAEEAQKARQRRLERDWLRFAVRYKKKVTDLQPNQEPRVSPAPLPIVHEEEETAEHCTPPMVQEARELVLGLYTRDTTLFARLMRYSEHGRYWLWTPCCYCGDPYEHNEHVLPLAALEKLRAAGDVQIGRDVLRIVPACAECNSLATDNVFWTFKEKRAYIKEQLARKYEAALRYPAWNDQELATLTGRLRDYVAAGQDIRNDILDRLRYRRVRHVCAGVGQVEPRAHALWTRHARACRHMGEMARHEYRAISARAGDRGEKHDHQEFWGWKGLSDAQTKNGRLPGGYAISVP